jgi:hypothetical protein
VPRASSIPSAASPRSATSFGTVAIVKSSATTSPTSDQRSGIDTRASARGRTE